MSRWDAPLSDARVVIVTLKSSLYRFFRVPNRMHSILFMFVLDSSYLQNLLSMSRACYIEVSSFKGKLKSSAYWMFLISELSIAIPFIS